jgi:hypothetical protein
MPPRTNLRDQIAEKRKEAQRLATPKPIPDRASSISNTGSSTGLLEDRTVASQIRKAGKTGMSS